MPKNNSLPMRERRQKEAADRKAERDSLTTEQHLMVLDLRPGASAKERQRLAKGGA